MPKYMEEDPEKRTCATYEDDNDFALLVCSISALAYVPEVDIPQAFYDLQQKIWNTYNNMEDNYNYGRQCSMPYIFIL